MRGGILFSLRGSIFQYRNVGAGKTQTIYLYKIPGDNVGFVSDLAVLWPENKNCYLTFIIDGKEIELIDRYIGKISDPRRIDPPYLVKDYIKFTGRNGSSVSQYFAVVADGLLYIKEPVIV